MIRKRVSKDAYYLGIAQEVSKRSTCIRRQYGAVIVKDDEIISTGYNGSPRGYANCSDTGECEREKRGCAQGERYDLCNAVHAEQNAMISASRREMLGSTLYLFCSDSNAPSPCFLCRKMIINAGIAKVVTMLGESVVDRPKSEECDHE